MWCVDANNSIQPLGLHGLLPWIRLRLLIRGKRRLPDTLLFRRCHPRKSRLLEIAVKADNPGF